MARYALYRIADGYIENMIELDNPGNYNPGPTLAVVPDPNGQAQMGGTWTGTEFLPPPPPPDPEPLPPSDDERLDALETSMASVLSRLDALENSAP